MDEHMVVDGGRTLRLDHDIIDENHKGLTFWTDKHNRYADREVNDLLALQNALGLPPSSMISPAAAAG